MVQITVQFIILKRLDYTDTSMVFHLITTVLMLPMFCIFINLLNKKTRYKIMFGFIKKMFIGLLSAWTTGEFGESLVFDSKRPIKCVSLNNQPCKTRPIHLLV